MTRNRRCSTVKCSVCFRCSVSLPGVATTTSQCGKRSDLSSAYVTCRDYSTVQRVEFDQRFFGTSSLGERSFLGLWAFFSFDLAWWCSTTSRRTRRTATCKHRQYSPPMPINRPKEGVGGIRVLEIMGVDYLASAQACAEVAPPAKSFQHVENLRREVPRRNDNQSSEPRDYPGS